LGIPSDDGDYIGVISFSSLDHCRMLYKASSDIATTITMIFFSFPSLSDAIRLSLSEPIPLQYCRLYSENSTVIVPFATYKNSIGFAYCAASRNYVPMRTFSWLCLLVPTAHPSILCLIEPYTMLRLSVFAPCIRLSFLYLSRFICIRSSCHD